MGALTPIASGLGAVSGTLGTIGGIVSTVQALSGNSASEQEQQLALRQLQDKQALQQAQLAQNSALEREKIALQAAQSEDERRAALKRAVAKQRAQYGGSGISTNGGSAQAVLLGLFEETEDEINKRAQLDQLKTASLDQDIASTQSINVLQRTQLAQRQKLERNLVDSFYN